MNNLPLKKVVKLHSVARTNAWLHAMQLFETMVLAIKSEGEAQQKVIKDLLDKLKLFGEGIKKIFRRGGGGFHN